MTSEVYLIGIAGGSGSGKTYFSKELQRRLGPENCEMILQDNFYIDQSHRFDFDGGAVNFDHPDSIDFSRLAECLSDLSRGKETQIPIYDFATHSRKKEQITIFPKPIIIVDGILIFHSPQVRELFHERIFFDTAEDIRFSRRLERDVKERGRSPEGIKNQFIKQVKPMHDTFVEPSKKYAHRIAHDSTDFEATLSDVIQRLKFLFR